MRIDKLTVTGFRCFDRAEFTFQPQFNLIVGENGSGKTSLLEALSVAAGAWLLGIRGYDSRNIEEEDIRMVPIQNGQEVMFEGCDRLVMFGVWKKQCRNGLRRWFFQKPWRSMRVQN